LPASLITYVVHFLLSWGIHRSSPSHCIAYAMLFPRVAKHFLLGGFFFFLHLKKRLLLGMESIMISRVVFYRHTYSVSILCCMPYSPHTINCLCRRDNSINSATIQFPGYTSDRIRIATGQTVPDSSNTNPWLPYIVQLCTPRTNRKFLPA